MFLGYNTNGFAHHRLIDAVNIITELGYQGVAFTPDIADFSTWVFPSNVLAVGERDRKVLQRFCGEWSGTSYRAVVETGSRFILDPRRKHQPTLISADSIERAHRNHFLSWCVDFSLMLNCRLVSFWSGTPSDDSAPSELMKRLVEQCKHLSEAAATKKVRLAFEPEPGMFIDTMDKFADLHARVNHPAFGLTIDVGHLVCNGELPVSKYLQDWKHVLWNVHIEDMKRGVHDHLMFGEGEVDFVDVFDGLRAANYTGGVYVELSRHSHDAVNTARKSKQFLDQFMTPK